MLGLASILETVKERSKQSIILSAEDLIEQILCKFRSISPMVQSQIMVNFRYMSTHKQVQLDSVSCFFSPSELNIGFAPMLSLSVCIPLFIGVSAMVATVVASVRASGCSHCISSHNRSFFLCYCLIYRVLILEISIVNA